MYNTFKILFLNLNERYVFLIRIYLNDVVLSSIDSISKNSTLRKIISLKRIDNTLAVCRDKVDKKTNRFDTTLY